MAATDSINQNSGLDTDLLPGSPKKKPNDPTPVQEKSRNILRSSLKNLAYGAIGVCALVFFFIMKLPADLIGRDALALLSQNTPYEWKAQKSELSFFLGPKLRFEKLQLTHRYPPIGTPPQKILLEKFVLAPNILQMAPIPGLKPFTPSANFSLEAFQGELSGSFKIGTSMIFEAQGEGISLEKVDFLKQNFKLNLKGKISSLKMRLEAPQSRFSTSLGIFNLQAKSIELDPSALTQGMAVPNLDIGNIVMQASIKNGKLTIDRFSAGDGAKDLELLADGQVQLKDPLDYSELDLRLRLKLSEKLTKSVPSLNGMLPIIAAKRPDGYFGTKIGGPLMAPSMPSPYLGN